MKTLSKLIQSAGLNLLPAAGDISSPTNGDIWYNSTTGRFRKQENGIISNLSSTLLTTSTQTNVDYTPVLADEETMVQMSSSAAHNFTVPLNASVAFNQGAQILVAQIGTGAVTIVATGGVTLNGPTLVTAGQWSIISLIKTGTDTWTVAAAGGDMVLAAVQTITGAKTFNAGTLITAAGTTAAAELKNTAGSLLTTAVAGAHEFDGVNKYFTNDTTSGRGRVVVEQMFKLDAAGSAITTIANFFGTTSNIPLVSGAYYEIDIWGFFLKGGTTGTNVISLINSAAPTSMDVFGEFSPLTGITATPTAGLNSQQYNLTTATSTITTGSLTISVEHFFHLKIFLRNGTGTSLQIQMTSNGSSSTPGIGSRWISKRISPSNVGAFAA